MWPAIRDALYPIAREAVGNAFRHAQASQIEVDVRFDARMLRPWVRDDGIGMEPNLAAQGRLQTHWGLPGMPERARIVGGQLRVWGELNRERKLS